MMVFFSASMLCLIGLIGLRYSWSRPDRSVTLNGLIWFCILLGLFLLGRFYGDRGVALGLCMFMVAALIFVAREMVVGSKGGLRETRRTKELVRPTKSVISGFKKFGTFLYVGLLQGALAFMGALGIHELMLLTGAEKSNSLVLALFMFPIIWAAISSYYLVGVRRLKKSAFLMLVPAFGAVLLVLGN